MGKKRTAEKPIEPGFVLGRDVDLANARGEILAVDQSGRVRCIVGYRRKDQPWDLAYFHPSVGAPEGGGNAPGRFIALERGTLCSSSFLHPEVYYKIIEDRWVVFPRGTDSHFGVIRSEDHLEDVQLTQAVFGATFAELELAARSFSMVIGRGYPELARLPRITFSKSRSNNCDLTQVLIPREFPYLAFEQAQYAWSHISLYGFYRILSFVCGSTERGPIAKAMMDGGLDAALLQRFIDNSQVYGAPFTVQAE